MLHRDDWLKAAQSLAIGQKRRIKHGFERTAALDVYNNEDSWSAYCHRCHVGGRVMKEHQSVRRAVLEPDRIQPVPATIKRLAEASEYEQRQAWSLLISKGCPPGVIPEEDLWIDQSVRRVMLTSKHSERCLGRALDTWRLPKWLPYGAWHGQPMVWTTRTGAGAQVLVEDALSGYKVAKAIQLYASTSSVGVVATLGTVITDRFLPHLVSHPVLCMYDGDSAGMDGLSAVRKRLAVWGQPVHDLRPVKGDPKNETLEALFQRLEKYL